ncbi:MAG TPA: hypothetical protein ENN73_00465 [Firmicutes bacterium]|nr:hypothetical protein [Bacillota bacterium]
MILLKIFGGLFATALIFTGLLFIFGGLNLGAFGYVIAGVVLILVGIVFIIIIFKGSKSSAAVPESKQINIVHNVELPNQSQLKEFLCKNCGASIKPENLKVTEAGSIMVTCPYCSTSYEIQEEPKW